MQKKFLPLLLSITFVVQTKAQQRLFDQPVQLKTCNITIDANPFIATTIIEMEFYNPKDQEVEAYQGFQLNRGQVITDFQLELNGKYREGSIEEKWKANNAYRSIVGKRIDPAILQMNGVNNYSLNIYPVAARSSRKIKFTITQLMEEEGSKLVYNLPLKFTGNTTDFTLKIMIKDPASIPYGNTGFLEKQLFDMGIGAASLSWQAKDIILNQAISFSINQFIDHPQVCISKKNGQAQFIMRVYNNVPVHYAATPKSLNVYWDVSLSAKRRNLNKELDFLESYISRNGINKTSIILFNQQLQGIIVFDRNRDNFNYIRNYLLEYKYNGSTDLRNLNLSNVLCDAILLFSDGINSMGTVLPKPGAVPVSCIVSSYGYDYNNLKAISANSGGTVINLDNFSVSDAVKKIDSAENFLFTYKATNIRINEQFPIRLGKSILLTGVIDAPGILELVYGNNNKVYASTDHFLPANENCDDGLYKKILMLKAYDSLMYRNEGYYRWQNMVIFGLTEKVVTPQTSYLVLERIEDYIKYKIAPPKELEEKCAEMNYVYRSEYKIRELKTFTEQEVLQTVVNNYNQRISWWNKNEPLIDLNGPVQEQKNIDATAGEDRGLKDKSLSLFAMQTDYKSSPDNLKEVVVSGGYGIRRSLKSASTNTQVISGEQLNTIRNTNINEAIAGKVAGIQLRGQSGAKLGNPGSIRLHGINSLYGSTRILYVLDGTRVDAEDINVDDVEDVTLLQGPAAAAIFGADGANGALVVTSKKARRKNYSLPVWGEYKLSSAEDEDYIQRLKNTAEYELWDEYLELEKEYKNDVGFYFEMADFFFEKHKPDKAQELLFNAIELCNGRVEGLKLAAYIYEKWGAFDKAIAIYQDILNANKDNLSVKRDLALAYFQDKKYEASVKIYYSIVTSPVSNNEHINSRENSLAEMNAVITLHKNEFDISYININLVKSLPLDLRITLESNYFDLENVQVIEPGNAICNYTGRNTVNGGRLMGGNNYWNDRSIDEYAIKNAIPGNYRIKVNAHDHYSYSGYIPRIVRVIVFKSFQKDNMKMQIKNFNLANQYGVIELDEVKW